MDPRKKESEKKEKTQSSNEKPSEKNAPPLGGKSVALRISPPPPFEILLNAKPANPEDVTDSSSEDLSEDEKSPRPGR